jgi:hypothetical protein
MSFTAGANGDVTGAENIARCTTGRKAKDYLFAAVQRGTKFLLMAHWSIIFPGRCSILRGMEDFLRFF